MSNKANKATTSRTVHMPFENLTGLTEGLFSASKKELDAKIAEEKSERQAERKRKRQARKEKQK